MREYREIKIKEKACGTTQKHPHSTIVFHTRIPLSTLESVRLLLIYTGGKNQHYALEKCQKQTKNANNNAKHILAYSNCFYFL